MLDISIQNFLIRSYPISVINLKKPKPCCAEKEHFQKHDSHKHEKSLLIATIERLELSKAPVTPRIIVSQIHVCR